MSTLNKPSDRHCLLVAHGSRVEASNDEIRKLAALLAGMNHDFVNVECAFLEIAKPSIPEGLCRCISLGAKEIVLIPYFLSAGRHVVSDIPDEVATVKQQFPEIAICITEHIGGNHGMADFLLAHALGKQAGNVNTVGSLFT